MLRILGWLFVILGVVVHFAPAIFRLKGAKRKTLAATVGEEPKE